jgi:hypothetical protein
VLCDVISVVTEFMVSDVCARCVGRSLQCLDGVDSGNGKRQWTPERNAISHTHARASTAQACDPIAASSANFCSKTRIVPAHEGQSLPTGPSVFGRNLQCQLVRERTPERNGIGHTHGSASSGANMRRVP